MVTQTGAGTTALTGTNTYTGGTTITAGTLIGNAASIPGNIVNAATVVFDQGADASFAGAIGGHGGVDGQMVKRGTGTLALTGPSSLDWSIEAGGLVTDASRFGGNVALASGASLTFDQGGNASYAGALSGSGAFGLTGSGVMMLTADSSGFAGTTTVANGGLIIGQNGAGALGGTVNVLSGGTLGGSGTIGRADAVVSIAAGGVHAPGDDHGQQTLLGDYLLRGTLRIGDTSGGLGTLHVHGGVDVAGSSLDLRLSPALVTNGSLVNSPYTLIDNQGLDAVSGSFAEVTSNLLFLAPRLDYAGGDGNDITFDLVLNDRVFASVAQTPNQRAVAEAANTLPPGDPVWGTIALANDEQALRQSFDELAGEIHATSLGVLLEQSRFPRLAVNEQLRAGAADADAAIWGHVYDSRADWRGDGNAAAVERSTGGLLMGLDAKLGRWRDLHDGSGPRVPRRSRDRACGHSCGHSMGQAGSACRRTSQ